MWAWQVCSDACMGVNGRQEKRKKEKKKTDRIFF